MIVDVNGSTIASADDLGAVLGKLQPGDSVSVVVNRDGQEKTFDVTPGRASHAHPDAVTAPNLPPTTQGPRREAPRPLR